MFIIKKSFYNIKQTFYEKNKQNIKNNSILLLIRLGVVCKK